MGREAAGPDERDLDEAAARRRMRTPHGRMNCSHGASFRIWATRGEAPVMPCYQRTGASLDLRPTERCDRRSRVLIVPWGPVLRQWEKETRRAGSTAGGNLIKWTPSRGVRSTFPMYDLVDNGKGKAANVTTGLYHECDDGNAGFGGSPSG